MASEQWKVSVLQLLQPHNSHRELNAVAPLLSINECSEAAKRQANACQSRGSTSIEEAASKDSDSSSESLSSEAGHSIHTPSKGATSVGVAASEVASCLSVGDAMGDAQSQMLDSQATPCRPKRKGTQDDRGPSPVKMKCPTGSAHYVKSPVKRSKRKKRAPICMRLGCGKPTWNGLAGEYCTPQAVWSASAASCHHLLPSL